MSQSAVWAVVPAAGAGTRMASATPKQYLPLLNKPVILHTLERLCAVTAVKGVWAGISNNDEYWPDIQARLAQHTKFRGSYAGGPERAHTVLNGLTLALAQASPDDWVLVHDAARPCVRIQDVEKLITDVITSKATGGILALPVSDTVKRVDRTQYITETVNRDGLWRALTPQMFRLGELKQALERALNQGMTVTDEASAMEAAGQQPVVVPGHADNIKITLPEDLALAELFLKQQQENN